MFILAKGFKEGFKRDEKGMSWGQRYWASCEHTKIIYSVYVWYALCLAVESCVHGQLVRPEFSYFVQIAF